MTGDLRELWFSAPHKVELRRGVTPDLLPGQVLLRAFASGISQGTELLLYRGEAPDPFDPSLDAPSTPVYPRRYGYAWVGEVVDVGNGVEKSLMGTRAFALAPHGDVHVAAASSLRCVDRAIPPTRAVLAANLETALTAVWDSRAALGDRVVVVGAGVVGLLSSWLLVRAGARVRVVEPSERRRALARELGAQEVVGPDADIPRAEADLVVEATGDPRSLDRAIGHAGREASVVIVSFYGTRTHPVLLGDAFHRRRLRLVSSQVSAIPSDRAARWSFERRFELVHELLHDARLDALVDPVVSFDDAPAAYAGLDAQPGASTQLVFTY